MDDLLATRTRLRSKATKLCNDLRSYREGDRNAIDQDQLALKLHHLQKLQKELQGVQDQLDKSDHADDTVTGRFRRAATAAGAGQPVLSPLPLTQIRYPEAGQSSAFTSVAQLLRYGGME